jgi:hypothetical protein
MKCFAFSQLRIVQNRIKIVRHYTTPHPNPLLSLHGASQNWTKSVDPSERSGRASCSGPSASSSSVRVPCPDPRPKPPGIGTTFTPVTPPPIGSKITLEWGCFGSQVAADCRILDGVVFLCHSTTRAFKLAGKQRRRLVETAVGLPASPGAAQDLFRLGIARLPVRVSPSQGRRRSGPGAPRSPLCTGSCIFSKWGVRQKKPRRMRGFQLLGSHASLSDSAAESWRATRFWLPGWAGCASRCGAGWS